MPYFQFDRVSIYLLIFSAGQGDHQTLKAEIEQEYAELIDFHVVPLQAQVAKIFGRNEPFYLLLRPDNLCRLSYSGDFVGRLKSLSE